VKITFAGTGKDFERRHVQAAGFQYQAISCRPLPRGPLGVPRFLADNLLGYWKASAFLRRQRVACVVGLGGYASVPMARAAVRQGIALVLLEQNATAGRATRWLAPAADAVCLALKEARNDLPAQCAIRVVGNPVRIGFGEFHRKGHPKRMRQLLILGGSSGARSLNESVPRALARLGPRLGGWRILHQSGPNDLEPVRALYATLELEATVTPFVADMPATLADTDLAVSRAGGTTLAELSVSGVPAVLVPYPHAADDHQGKNAAVWTAAGGCIAIDQRDPSGDFCDRLAAALGPLLRDGKSLAAMAGRMRKLARPSAARDIAEMVLNRSGLAKVGAW